MKKTTKKNTAGKTARQAAQSRMEELVAEMRALSAAQTAPANPLAALRDDVEREETLSEIERLRAENAALRSAKPARPEPRLTFRISSKGGVSVYGLGRFPVTLYRRQWETLIAVVPALKQFIAENSASLSGWAE